MGVHVKKDGRVFVVTSEGGSRKWVPFGRGDIALAKAHQYVEKLESDRGKSHDSDLTVGKLIAAYAENHAVCDSTAKMDKYKFEILSKYLGGYRADLLTTDHLNKYVKRREKDPVTKTIVINGKPQKTVMLREGITRTTIAYEIRRLKAVYNWACNQYPPLMLFNPIAHYKLSRTEPPDVPNPPTLAELNLILARAEPHLARAILIFFHTGIRPGGELCRIHWRDVDLSSSTIRITGARKGGPSYRTIPIVSADFIRNLTTWREADLLTFPRNLPDSPVVHYNKKPVMSLKHAWQSAKLHAGITRRIRLYDLRHAFASLALQNGADLKSLSEVLGHSRPDTTLRSYQHVTRQQHRDVLAKLPSLSTSRLRPAEGSSHNK